MTDLRALQVRVGRLGLVDQATCATLGALSLIIIRPYNHLLFTVSLYRIWVFGVVVPPPFIILFTYKLKWELEATLITPKPQNPNSIERHIR